MSVPGKPGWLHKVNKPFAEPDNVLGQCRTHQNGECLPPICAPDPGETYRQPVSRKHTQRKRHDNWDVKTKTWWTQRCIFSISLHLSLTSLTSGSLEKSHCLSWAPRHSASSCDNMKWSTAIVKLRMYEASDVTSSNFAWVVDDTACQPAFYSTWTAKQLWQHLKCLSHLL